MLVKSSSCIHCRSCSFAMGAALHRKHDKIYIQPPVNGLQINPLSRALYALEHPLKSFKFGKVQKRMHD